MNASDATSAESFGRWLRRRREELGFETTAALARATSLDQPTLSRWENDQVKRTPEPENLRKLAKPLRTPVLVLFVRAGILSIEEANLTRESLLDQQKDDLAELIEVLRNDHDRTLRLAERLLKDLDSPKKTARRRR